MDALEQILTERFALKVWQGRLFDGRDCIVIEDIPANSLSDRKLREIQEVMKTNGARVAYRPIPRDGSIYLVVVKPA